MPLYGSLQFLLSESRLGWRGGRELPDQQIVDCFPPLVRICESLGGYRQSEEIFGRNQSLEGVEASLDQG
jgi:hypothetical protein